jgi:anti-sigma factor RsiW
MSKHLTETQLHDLCDDALPASKGQTLRRHLDGCGTCRDRMAHLEALLAAAAAEPTKIPPPEDLWSSIRARIESGKIAAIAGGPSGPAPTQPWWASTGAALGTAAVLVLVTATITAILLSPEPQVVAPGTSSGPIVAPVNAPVQVSMLIANYEGLTNRLAQEFARLRHRLPPEAVASVEGNLRVVDEALAEIQEVLDQEPDNAALLQLLATTYRQKVSVLEHATESIS